GPIDVTRVDGQHVIVGRDEDDDRRVLDALFGDLDVVPIHVAEVGEYFVAAAMASSGIAMTLMPIMAIPASYPLVDKRLSQPLEKRTFLATRRDGVHADVAAFRRTRLAVIRRR